MIAEMSGHKMLILKQQIKAVGYPVRTPWTGLFLAGMRGLTYYLLERISLALIGGHGTCCCWILGFEPGDSKCCSANYSMWLKVLMNDQVGDVGTKVSISSGLVCDGFLISHIMIARIVNVFAISSLSEVKADLVFAGFIWTTTVCVLVGIARMMKLMIERLGANQESAPILKWFRVAGC